MSNKCYQCGTIHDGWSCPICSVKEKVEESTKEQQQAIEESLEEQERMLEEQREAIESSIEDSRMEMEHTLEEAAAKHQKTTSEAWKLQAEAKVDRAYELYKANLYEEATKLCFDAISQDPGNIRAYRFAAWSFEKLGQHEKTRELLKKQINLLKTSYYSNSQVHVLRVLQDIIEIQRIEDLMNSFLNASKVFSFFPADLIDELIAHSLYNNAQRLYLNTIKYSENLLGHAYGIELNKKVVGREKSDMLNMYLKGVPYTQRNNIFEAFKKIKCSGKFSEDTTNFIHKNIHKRYEEWKPEIKIELAKDADQQAKKVAEKKSSPHVIGLIVGICSFLPWVGIGLTVSNTVSKSASMFFSAFVALFVLVVIFGGPIATIIFTSYIVQSYIENKIKAELVTAMEKKEKENLQKL